MIAQIFLIIITLTVFIVFGTVFFFIIKSVIGVIKRKIKEKIE